MGLIKKSNELVIPQTVKMMIYGQAGMGKTTVALSAPKPLLLDFDNGVKRVNTAHLENVDIVQVDNWKEIQQFVRAIVPTRFGNVEVYGYVDELMPQSIHDIKTTGKYSVGKFKDHWQHHVYSYCYDKAGMFIPIFEYNIAEIDKYGRWATYTETYNYRPEETFKKLVEHCEALICFLEEHRSIITDEKIAPVWKNGGNQ